MADIATSGNWSEIFLKISRVFGFNDLSSDQKRTLMTVVDEKRDVFVFKKTGSGKSIHFEALTLAAKLKQTTDKPVVVVVCPLVSIMKEHSENLSRLGISATYVGKDTDHDLRALKGEFEVIFSSPEQIVGKDEWRRFVKEMNCQERLVAIAVDEVHTVINWGESESDTVAFRSWFAHVGELRSLAPSVPVVAVTATATLQMRRKLARTLGMEDPVIIADSPDRQNIRISVNLHKATTPIKDLIHPLCTRLVKLANGAPRTLIFCRTINEASKVFDAFREALTNDCCRHVDLYHSMTPEGRKEKIRSDLSDGSGNIRILIATDAAGMGVNFASVYECIHYGPPYNTDTYIQQMGRVGRDGTQSHAVLLYNKRQTNKKVSLEMKAYLQNTEDCRREQISLHYNADFQSLSPIHLCCDICSVQCECLVCPPIQHILERDLSELQCSSVSHDRERFVSKKDEAELKCRLTGLKLRYDSELSVDRHALLCKNGHGYSHSHIDKVVANAEHIFTESDLLDNCGLWSFQQALDILAVFNDLFGDLEVTACDSDFTDNME